MTLTAAPLRRLAILLHPPIPPTRGSHGFPTRTFLNRQCLGHVAGCRAGLRFFAESKLHLVGVGKSQQPASEQQATKMSLKKTEINRELYFFGARSGATASQLSAGFTTFDRLRHFRPASPRPPRRSKTVSDYGIRPPSGIFVFPQKIEI